MEIIIRDNPEQAAAAAAELFAQRAQERARENGICEAAVSGGRTPLAFFEKLAGEPYLSLVPWDAIRLWWVDERCVPPNDPQSNYGAARRILLDRVPLPQGQAHPMPGEMPPTAGADEYQARLIHHFWLPEGGFPVFDMVFLGLGGDGHIASLFPGHKELKEKKRLVVAAKGGSPALHRLTLTLPVINRARDVVFLVAGEDKAAVVRAVLTDTEGSLPAQQVKPVNGRLTWILDRAAASIIKGEK